MAIELIKIDTDTDGNGLSIVRRLTTTINGVTYYAAPERRAFRRIAPNPAGELVVNQSFAEELNEFTGISNFLNSFYNF